MSAPDPRASATPCRGCGARVVWAGHEVSGSIAAIDAEPHPEGRFMLWQAPGGRWKYGRVTRRAAEVVPLYRSHQQTCNDPNFQRLRKIRRGDPAYAPLTTPMRSAHTHPAMKSPQEELPL